MVKTKKVQEPRCCTACGQPGHRRDGPRCPMKGTAVSAEEEPSDGEVLVTETDDPDDLGDSELDLE